MRDIVKRAIQAQPELAAELWRRGLFSTEEKAEIRRHRPGYKTRSPHMGSVQLATLLAQGDSQLAARAVLREVLREDELRWLERMLRFRKRNRKRDELIRIVERALEGRKGNVRKSS
jgi:hypothetical protein